jgi:tetratricopeptide (TPR) repeat protein
MQPLIPLHRYLEGALAIAVFLALAGWGVVRVLKRSEDPALLIFKWLLTALVCGWMCWEIKPFSGPDPDWTHVVVALAGALILAAIWRQNIASFVSKPFESLFTGGNVEIEPQAYYSVAESKRKLGKFTDAVGEIRKQLERFPTDFHGQMMLAEIQAQDLNDLPGAELTIRRICEQPGHAPRNIMHALSTLADWHLKYSLDREAARADLQQVVDRFPDTDLALSAAQRIAHLATTEKLIEPHDRKRVAVVEGVKNLGLATERTRAYEFSETETGDRTAEYVKHLEQYPLDSEVREKLAMIYADHYKRLDLASDQLEQLIGQPNQPVKRVTHWLNLLADLQVRHGADYSTVENTLLRILDQYPNTPVAELARTRLSHLKLEFKGREKAGTGLKMGTYEQNIGLKRGPAKQY